MLDSAEPHKASPSSDRRSATSRRAFPFDAVTDAGEVKLNDNGASPVLVNDAYLRGEFPPAGKGRAPRVGDSPMDRYENAVSRLLSAAGELDQAHRHLREVIGDDGQSIVEARGGDPMSCRDVRARIQHLEEDLIVWSSTFKRKMGLRTTPVRRDADATSADAEMDGAVRAAPGPVDMAAQWDLEQSSDR